MKKNLATIGLIIGVFLLLAIVGALYTATPRERVMAFNVPNPTSCVSGIVYFIDKGSKSVITPVIDAKTDKPKHCE